MLSAAPGGADSHYLLASGQLEQAEASYRREIELTPEHFGPHHMLGVVLHQTARHAEAIEQFKRALSLNPNSSATYSSLGTAYLDLDDTAEENLALAQLSYEKAVALEPGNSECHCNLGFNYWRRVELDRALASFDRAIEADPNNAKARWARAMLWAPAFAAAGSGGAPERSGFGVELAKFIEQRRSVLFDDQSDMRPFQDFLASTVRPVRSGI